MLKFLKSNNHISKKMEFTVKNGHALDRMVFFIIILCFFCHIFACVWIFFGKHIIEDGEDAITWLIGNNLTREDMGVLYSTSIYFTMQTLTTVGYGDINITSTYE